MKNTVTVRPGRALVRAICLLLLRLDGSVRLEPCLNVWSHRWDDLADGGANDPESDTVGHLDLHRLVVQRADDAEDPRGQHDLVPHGHRALHPRHRLLSTLLGPD